MDNCGKPQSIGDKFAGVAEANRQGGERRSGGATATLGACSACAGDYEDPDGGRAGAPEESGEDEEQDEAEYLTEEFPAEEQ